MCNAYVAAFSGGSPVLFVAINIPIPFKALMYGTVSPVSQCCYMRRGRTYLILVHSTVLEVAKEVGTCTFSNV